MPNVHVAHIVHKLLAHANNHGAKLKGGVRASPSAGFYYELPGGSTSVWSLFLKASRPSITLNFGSVHSRDPDLAVHMVLTVRGDPVLDAALLQGDAEVAKKYPSIDLHALAESPGAVGAVIQALDIAVGGGSHHLKAEEE
jgi:hypothetical protein